MKKNLGTPDRLIRILLAIVIFALYFSGIITGTLGIVLIILAVIFVLTSLVTFCPLYAVFGIKTICAPKEEKTSPE